MRNFRYGATKRRASGHAPDREVIVRGREAREWSGDEVGRPLRFARSVPIPGEGASSASRYAPRGKSISFSLNGRKERAKRSGRAELFTAPFARLAGSQADNSLAMRRAAEASKRRWSAQSSRTRRPHVTHRSVWSRAGRRTRPPALMVRPQIAHAVGSVATVAENGRCGAAGWCRSAQRLTRAARSAARSRRSAGSTCPRAVRGRLAVPASRVREERGCELARLGSRKPRRRRRSSSRSVARR
jgi:hypothetical protein